MKTTIGVETDTALICIIDPELFAEWDDRDEAWWSDEAKLLKRVNAGELFYARVGSDGVFDVHVHDNEPSKSTEAVKAHLTCPSGRLFIGGAERLIDLNASNGTESDGIVKVESGNYDITFAVTDETIDVCMKTTDSKARNHFKKLPDFVE